MTFREHRQLRRLVQVYLDGEADPHQAALAHRHLSECWVCSEDAEWTVLVKATLRKLASRHRPELVLARLTRYADGLLGEH